jgi:putative membrane protein
MSAEWQAFWTSWQFDAWLTLALVLVALIYLRGWLRLRQRGARRFSPWRLAAFFLAVSTVGLATQSPIEPFSTLLLQMHMLQHVLLMFVAPPLVWMADPELPLLVGLPKVLRRHLAVPILRDPLVRWVTHLLAHPAVALGLFVVTAWTWHLPALYQAALTSQTWHQVEHASFFLAAIVFWRVVIGPYPNRSTLSRWIVLPYLLVAGLQGTVFSGLLTFSDRLFYPHYETVPRLWNIAPLDDQAIAGALMWFSGSVAYLLALAWVAAELWNETPQPQMAGTGRRLPAGARERQKTALRISKLGTST